MVRHQNLTRKPELFRAPCARAPLGPGLGTMYPLNPLSQALLIFRYFDLENASIAVARGKTTFIQRKL